MNEETQEDALKSFDLVAENKRLLELSQKQKLDLEHAHQLLKQVIEKQTAFTTTVSHELRTPLSSMKMAVEMILRGSAFKKWDAADTRYLNIAKTNIERLSRLIDDILDLSKLEAGKITLLMEPRDMQEIVHEVVEVEMPFAKQKGLSLSVEWNAAPELVSINPDKMIQALHNLVKNAIKFTEKGSVVISGNVRQGDQGRYLEVCVRDTGKGIAAEDIPRLFQKFEQLGLESEKVNSTGLGLAICKEILSQHQGRLWVESELGKGSAFFFSLPFWGRSLRG